MTIDQTQPLPLTAVQVQANRRKGQHYRARIADLDRALRPALMRRDEAATLAAQMDARSDKWPEEREALRDLMHWHGITFALIRHEQRRSPGSR